MYLEGEADQETGPQAQGSERGELELLVASDRESTTTSFSTRRELMGPHDYKRWGRCWELSNVVRTPSLYTLDSALHPDGLTPRQPSPKDSPTTLRSHPARFKCVDISIIQSHWL